MMQEALEMVQGALVEKGHMSFRKERCFGEAPRRAKRDCQEKFGTRLRRNCIQGLLGSGIRRWDIWPPQASAWQDGQLAMWPDCCIGVHVMD
jgi:hypothetical protein